MELLSLEDAPLLRKWLTMCASNAEFIENYNRLCGTSITFRLPDRLRIERLVDEATGHVPMPQNDEGELSAFLRFCLDCYQRLPLPV